MVILAEALEAIIGVEVLAEVIVAVVHQAQEAQEIILGALVVALQVVVVVLLQVSRAEAVVVLRLKAEVEDNLLANY